jgi:hypothetical protein
MIDYYAKIIRIFLLENQLNQNLLQLLDQQKELNQLINHLNQSKYKDKRS